MIDTMPPLNLAPGCFGLALTFVADSVECKTCEFKIACEPIHLRRKSALHKALGIKTKNKNGISKSVVSRTLDAIEEKHIDVAGKIGNGENPFDNTFPKLKLGYHLLLNMSGKANDDMLKMAFIRKMGIDQDKANEVVSYVVTTLYALDAIYKKDGKYFVRTKENGNKAQSKG